MKFDRLIDLNEREKKVLEACVRAALENGLDFGCIEDVMDEAEALSMTANQLSGYLSRLSTKGYIEIYPREKINGEHWVTQFTLSDEIRDKVE